MNGRTIHLVALGLLAIVCAVAVADELARVREVRGDASVRRAQTGQYEDLRGGEVLGPGDFIATDVDSEVTLVLKGGATIRLSELSQIRMTQELLSSDAKKLQLFLRTGSVSTEAPPETLKGTGFSVKTPAATSSIRGTTFTVAHYDGFGTEVSYSSGRGHTFGPGGRTLIQAAGQVARAEPRRGIAGPVTESLRRVGLQFAPPGRSPLEVDAARVGRPLNGQPPGDPTDPNRLQALSVAGGQFFPRFRVFIDVVP
ncbi:MAG: FecR domain-containing protein [Candidatus Wallbacteria bacterium]|nr:FecR domain-containing protein [Candidatus Wallbacteria bacterium]MBI4868633.1 FecR domain-containing protein [Candidatus Wallbacteria bacterium]